jgi:D-lactate dehydrogenase
MSKNSHVLQLLRKVKCFTGLDEETLALIQEQLQPRIYQPDQSLCQEGEPGDRMFIIESGKVAVLKQGAEGVLIEVAVLEEGDIAGELGLFAESVRSASLNALTETKAWILSYDVFQELLEQSGELARGLLGTLSKHLCRETSVVAKLLSRDMDCRFKVAFFDSKPYVEEIFKEQNQHNYSLHFFNSPLTIETVSLAAGFEVVCVFVNDCLDEKVLKELHGLDVKLIALRCAGFNNVDLAACEKLGIGVVRVPAYSPYAVAEHAAALMMTLNRRIHRANNRIREGNFSLAGLMGFDMHDKTAGIIGAGKIGKCLLNILGGFGCKLLAYDKYPDQDLIDKLGVQYVDLDKLFLHSDIISLHAPLLPETRYLINAEAIEKMKTGVMLINTSRGALVDTRALLDGLKSGKIGYAGLDVYEEESNYFFEDFSDRVLTDDVLARLTTFNNVLVTSHQGFLTREALGNIADTTFENIRAYESGCSPAELPNRVCNTA